MDKNQQARQALFDLMCNKQIELTISGEMNEVDGELKVWEWGAVAARDHGHMVSVAQVIGAADWESALVELMEKYAERK